MIRPFHPRTKPITFEVDENNCFICVSHARDWDGYPLFKRRGKVTRISRFIYEECHGPIPTGNVVRHTCDNPNCINPEHLIIGTHRQNSKDMVSRGRSAKGEKNGSAKLKEHQVLEIRSLADRYSGAELARMFDVSEANISDIINRKIWRYI